MKINNLEQEVLKVKEENERFDVFRRSISHSPAKKIDLKAPIFQQNYETQINYLSQIV